MDANPPHLHQVCVPLLTEITAGMAEENTSLQVALLPSVGMGHLIPFCALAKRLSTEFKCAVTLIRFDSISASPYAAPFFAAFANNSGVTLLTVPDETPPKDLPLAERIVAMAVNNIPRLRQILSDRRISLLITDLFCTPIIQPLGVSTYVFFTSPVALLSLMVSAPRLPYGDGRLSLRESEAVITLPGLPPFRWTNLPEDLWDCNGFSWFQTHCETLKEVRGFLVNTFLALEKSGLEGLQQLFGDPSPSVYAVGPLISAPAYDDASDCLRWLDRQPPLSVMYVSFGSSVALSEAEVTELAMGLEASEQRFLWVLRKSKSSSPVSYFEVADTPVEEILPEGFVKRTLGRGLVLAPWGPQMGILSHGATGGFLSHCGWNSVLESVLCGVPMVCWPMFAEQNMNAFLVVNEFGVGIDVQTNGKVKKEGVERSVRELMEGEGGRKARERARKLSEMAVNALGEGGSSWNGIAQAVSEWKAVLPRTL